jgi:hypothetical protein
MTQRYEIPTWFEVDVEFYSEGGRKRPVALGSGKYWPHLRVAGDGEYLGVKFVRGPEWVELGSSARAIVETIFEGVDYTKMKSGIHFEILEGPRAVGRGTVLRHLEKL